MLRKEEQIGLTCQKGQYSEVVTYPIQDITPYSLHTLESGVKELQW